MIVSRLLVLALVLVATLTLTEAARHKRFPKHQSTKQSASSLINPSTAQDGVIRVPLSHRMPTLKDRQAARSKRDNLKYDPAFESVYQSISEVKSEEDLMKLLPSIKKAMDQSAYQLPIVPEADYDDIEYVGTVEIGTPPVLFYVIYDTG